MRLSTSNINKTKTAGRKLFLFAACGFFAVILLSGMSSAPVKKVFIRKIEGSRYQLVAGGKPYIIKGVCYNPIPPGQSFEFDWWSDKSKPWIVDGKLMSEMGINTIRLYQTHEDLNEVKAVVSDLYNKYGIRSVIGDWLGFWEYPCPFYGDKAFQDRVKKNVLDMVETLKDEPGILFWVLGNENNYSCLGHVNPWSSDEIDNEPDPQKQRELRAKIYYSFVNDIAKEIKKIDPDHPVALGNGELVGLEFAKEFCPDIDIVACIIYRGRTFGNLFRSLKMTYDRPVFFAEFGADAYDIFAKKEDQNMQAFFLESQWRQIYANLYNNKTGEGNCIGGTVFEWVDEWWKHNPSDSDAWKTHDTEGGWTNGNYYYDIKVEGGKNMNEEWFGIVALSEQLENGLNKRIPRKAYYVIREFWKNPDLTPKKKGNK
jgi:hypothetical protein